MDRIRSSSGFLRTSGSRHSISKKVQFFIYNLFYVKKYSENPLAAEIYKALEQMRKQAEKIYPKFEPVIDGYEKFLATFDEKFPTRTSGYKLQEITPFSRILKAVLSYLGAVISILVFSVVLITTSSNTYSPLALGFLITAYSAIILSIVQGSLSQKARFRFISLDEGESGGFFAPIKMLFCKTHGWIKLALFWLFLLFAPPSVAQSFSVNGRLINGVDSIPLAGFNVEIRIRGPPGTKYYRTTGPNGEFSIITDLQNEEENNNTNTIDATITSVSSRPYITIKNTIQPEAEIIIYDILGRKIKEISAPITNGINNIQWNARNEHNEPVSDGTYITRIKIGNEIFDKKFIIIKGNTEGTPQQYIRREIKKIEKTTADYAIGIVTFEEKGYEATETELKLENSTTPEFHITLPKKENIENTFPSNGTEVKTLSNLLNHYDINTTAKPVYPIQINTTGLPANIKTAITNSANEINNKTGKNITKITTTPNTNSSLLECVVVNNDTTIPITTNNTYGIWTEHDTIIMLYWFRANRRVE